MKGLLIYIGRFFMTLIYGILKGFPTDEEKVVFLSRQSDELTLDFKMTQDRLRQKQPGIKIVTICSRLDDSKAKSLGHFAIDMLKSMYHMATSNVVVLDAYWPAVSLLKHKKSLTVIQLWHALGKIKKSGYQTLDKESGRSKKMARLLKMHRGYDYIVAGGTAWNPFYCQSFDTEEEKLINCGLPRIDYLLETRKENRTQVLEVYPEFRKKKTVLYAPTFRRNMEAKWEQLVEDLLGKNSENEEEGDFALIVKSHPNQKLKVDEEMREKGVHTCPQFTAVQLLGAVDYLVTDYSAIAIEGGILNVPTYYFLYDYEDYEKKNGMNIDLFKEMKGCAFRSSRELVDAIKSGRYPEKVLEDYRKKYLPKNLGTSTEQVTDLIIRSMGR